MSFVLQVINVTVILVANFEDSAVEITETIALAMTKLTSAYTDLGVNGALAQQEILVILVIDNEQEIFNRLVISKPNHAAIKKSSFSINDAAIYLAIVST